jgi:hypothetical protein
MGLTDLFLTAINDPKTRLISQGEHAHIRSTLESSPVNVGYCDIAEDIITPKASYLRHVALLVLS